MQFYLFSFDLKFAARNTTELQKNIFYIPKNMQHIFY